MDIKDRLEEYSQSVEIDILNAIQSSKAKLSLIRNIYEKPLHSFPHLTCTQQKKMTPSPLRAWRHLSMAPYLITISGLKKRAWLNWPLTIFFVKFKQSASHDVLKLLPIGNFLKIFRFFFLAANQRNFFWNIHKQSHFRLVEMCAF